MILVLCYILLCHYIISVVKLVAAGVYLVNDSFLLLCYLSVLALNGLCMLMPLKNKNEANLACNANLY